MNKDNESGNRLYESFVEKKRKEECGLPIRTVPVDTNDVVMSCEEKCIYRLRKLYSKYGYLPYKMGKFEESDLKDIAQRVAKLTAKGSSVSAQKNIPEKLRYRQIMDLRKG